MACSKSSSNRYACLPLIVPGRYDIVYTMLWDFISTSEILNHKLPSFHSSWLLQKFSDSEKGHIMATQTIRTPGNTLSLTWLVNLFFVWSVPHCYLLLKLQYLIWIIYRSRYSKDGWWYCRIVTRRWRSCEHPSCYASIYLPVRQNRSWAARTDDGDRHTHEPPVLLLVGPSKKAFYIHRSLLREQSPYFSARLQECWGGSEKAIELDEFDPTAFDAAVHWMYTKTLLPLYVDRMNSTESTRKCDISHIWTAYGLGDRLMMVDLQNSLMDQIILCSEKYDSAFEIDDLGDITATLLHSPCYRFGVKSAVMTIMRNSKFYGKDFWADKLECLREYPDIMQDILLAITEWNAQSWTARCTDDLCDFHIHPDNRRCPNPRQTS